MSVRRFVFQRCATLLKKFAELREERELFIMVMMIIAGQIVCRRNYASIIKKSQVLARRPGSNGIVPPTDKFRVRVLIFNASSTRQG